MIANSLRKAFLQLAHWIQHLRISGVFGYMKGKLRAMELDEPQQLFPAIVEILTELTIEILNQVFEE
jgi:hypothetical protein